MSGYNGRRGPNVSQYVAKLNTIPSAQDTTSRNQDPLEIESDLALFTNTEFFDFDLGEVHDLTQPVDYDPAMEERARRQNASAYSRHLNSNNTNNNSSKSVDFMDGDFKFPDFSSFPNTVADPSMSNLQSTQINGYHIPTYSPPASASPISPQFDKPAGEKRKLDAITDPNSVQAIEETSRVAAEEDKRRRNTAASARFRVKKKQREQALEKTAKEMTDKVSVLESKITQLETENKWLKSLITEKNESSADITAMYKKFTKENSEARSTGERTDGVGTGAGHNEKAKA